MTRRSRKKTGRKNRRMGRRTFLLGAGAAACVAAGLYLRRVTSPAAADSTPEPSADPNPALPAGEWRAYTPGSAKNVPNSDRTSAGRSFYLRVRKPEKNPSTPYCVFCRNIHPPVFSIHPKVFFMA